MTAAAIPAATCIGHRPAESVHTRRGGWLHTGELGRIAKPDELIDHGGRPLARYKMPREVYRGGAAEEAVGKIAKLEVREPLRV